VEDGDYVDNRMVRFHFLNTSKNTRKNISSNIRKLERSASAKKYILWRSSLIVFIDDVCVLLYDASKTGNPLTV
jgi:hypothetical protein